MLCVVVGRRDHVLPRRPRAVCSWWLLPGRDALEGRLRGLLRTWGHRVQRVCGSGSGTGVAVVWNANQTISTTGSAPTRTACSVKDLVIDRYNAQSAPPAFQWPCRSKTVQRALQMNAIGAAR